MKNAPKSHAVASAAATLVFGGFAIVWLAAVVGEFETRSLDVLYSGIKIALASISMLTLVTELASARFRGASRARTVIWGLVLASNCVGVVFAGTRYPRRIRSIESAPSQSDGTNPAQATGGKP